MYFRNDHAELEILIGGYTDCPERYSEEVGKNALECQASFEDHQTGRNFVMWDEIFQTDEIAEIRDGIQTILSSQKDSYIFDSQYKTFAISLHIEGERYSAKVYLHSVGDDVTENFLLSRDELSELLDYLSDCCEKFPVR